MAENTQSPVSKPSSASAWAKRKEHEVTLPSGAQVDIVLPNLPALAKAGQIPNELLEQLAKASEGPRGLTNETLLEENEWRRFIVARMVVKPKVEPEQVDDLPAEDLEMLTEFAMRKRDQDAVGHHLAGLEVSDDWRRFRDRTSTLETLLGGA